MRIRLKKYRSAGIPVSPKCHRAIVAADKARETGDWSGAAAFYRMALAESDGLQHIRVQLGHALKEQGLTAEAEREYRLAHNTAPSDRDAMLHLGHILKTRQQFEEASSCYMSLALANPADDEAMREACDTIRFLAKPEREALAARLIERSAVESWSDDAATSDCGVVYDASDLLSYFRHARRPTGIQRVQIEIIVAGLRRGGDNGRSVGVCCFVTGRDEWVGIPARSFLSLAEISLADDDRDDTAWNRERDRLQLWLLVAPTFEFALNAVLVNLGTSWWLQNYFLHVRDAQRRRGIVYIPLVYDMIPVLFPHFCTDDLIRDFISWLHGVFAHTTQFLAISHCSKRDLIATSAQVGHDINDKDVTVIPLDANFRSNAENPGSRVCLPVAISDRAFVLQVSTIEPRKGHLVALEAWSLLIDWLGVDAVPQLVFVGRKGWRNDAVYDRLKTDPVLHDKITFLSDISDDELSELYRLCLFTIYPSLYEGWGLPVTEALCRGKAVITTSSSSLPEAGGDLAIYVPPGNAYALADAARVLIAQPDVIAAMEARIAATFTPRSWSAIADQVGEAVIQLAERQRNRRDRIAQPGVAQFGITYWLGRSYAFELRKGQASGEEFRAGLHWDSPDMNGSRIKGSGELSFRVLERAKPGLKLKVTLRIIGRKRRSSHFSITGGYEVVRRDLAPNERLNIDVYLKEKGDGVFCISIDEVSAYNSDKHNPRDIWSDGIAVECFWIGY